MFGGRAQLGWRSIDLIAAAAAATAAEAAPVTAADRAEWNGVPASRPWTCWIAGVWHIGSGLNHGLLMYYRVKCWLLIAATHGQSQVGRLSISVACATVL